jgi:hypothetical protein
VVLAGALGVVGLGLVVGSWWGRSVGLVVVALLLGLALAATVAVRPILDHGVGERTWHPGTASRQSFRLGVGEATLDLNGLPTAADGAPTVTARVDVGHLVVLVPAGLRVAVTAKAGVGDVTVLGADHNGRTVTVTDDLGPAGPPDVRLSLSVRTGQVEVLRG